MSGVYEQYLIRLLAPLGLYDLSGVQNRSELAAWGMELDNVSAALDTVERESLLVTAEDQGLSRREALFARKPAALTAEERRAAVAALLRIGEDSLTPDAINDTLVGCGIRARAEEKADGGLRVVFPGTAGIPAEFGQIQKIILDILPCHLDVEFYFRYLTWVELAARFPDWASLEAEHYSWEQLELAV